MKPKVLLLSAYDAGSHKRWRIALAAMFPNFEWTQLALPPRNFAWRIRGNSLLWAFDSRELLQQPFDLLIATSMVDLASLRGLVPALARIPTVVYFHENQFAYPINQQLSADAANFSQANFSRSNVEPKLVPLYSALCGDEIVFNSEYNRDSFLQGCLALFERLPDKVPAEVMAKLNRNLVISVPLLRAEVRADTVVRTAEMPTNSVLEVIWNHRWEFDKGPDVLLKLVQLVVNQGLAVRFHIVGEKFRQVPTEFSVIEELLSRHYQNLDIQPGRFGFVADADDYHQLLRTCDIVLSTAIHDFQGLALQEAIVAGCTPLAPQRLVYPEYLDQQFLYAGSPDTPEWVMALEKLEAWQQHKARGRALPKSRLERFHSEELQAAYADLFKRLLSKSTAGSYSTRSSNGNTTS